MKYLFQSLILFSFLLPTSALSADTTYSWENEKGQLFFGNNPPADAMNLKELSNQTFSRYSSTKLLKPYNNIKTQRALAPTKKTLIPEPSRPAELKHGKLSLTLNQDGNIASCKTTVENKGDLTAANITVSFEFDNGIIVPALGQEVLSGGEAASFEIEQSHLPIPVTGNTKEPKVIIQFSEA